VKFLISSRKFYNSISGLPDEIDVTLLASVEKDSGELLDN